MSENKKGFLRLLAFAVIVLLLFSAVSAVFHPKDGKDASGYTQNITMAYRAEENNTIDIAFIGNSNAYRAFNPSLLWEQHGITSCSIGAPMMRMDEVYYYIHDLYKTQSPKVVAVETNCFYSYLQDNETHKQIADGTIPTAAVGINPIAFKVSYDKEYFEKLLDDLNDAILSKVAYSASLMKHHDRWRSLEKNDFTNTRQQYFFVSKGYLYSDTVKPFGYNGNYMGGKNDEPQKMSKYNLFFFDKLYKLCQKHGTTLALVCAPCATNWDYQRHNFVKQLADDYGVDFVDYNLLPIGIDWKKDTKDEGTHLNVYGANKVTTEYAKVIVNTYNLSPSELTDKQKRAWDKDAKRYHTEIEK